MVNYTDSSTDPGKAKYQAKKLAQRYKRKARGR